MSEDDRAAKAARAKAMLKKRQQKKASDNNVAPSILSPPPSRTFSPVPSEPVDDKRDLGDLFAKDDTNDTSWLNSLPQVEPPNPNDAQLKPDTESLRQQLEEMTSTMQKTEALLEEETRHSRSLDEQIAQLQAERENLLENQQQTISLLVSEKTQLSSDLERLEGIEAKAQATEDILSTERSKINRLEQQVHHLEAQVADSSQQNQSLLTKQKAQTDKTREQERELQLTKATVNTLRNDVEKHQSRVQELEAHIQSDDRAERLEKSLTNAQDRADELEFQLSKLKQVHNSLKAERDELDSQARIHRESTEEWKSKHADLFQAHSSVQEQLAASLAGKDTFHSENESLRAEVASTRQTFEELQEKMNQTVVDLATHSRQLQVAQTELKAANRRADEAERIQKDLQTEGTDLMRSLEEMRPKIVELTGVKLELGDSVERLEEAVRNRDTSIAQLESTLDEIRDQHEQATKDWEAQIAKKDKEYALSNSNSTELQTAYADLQDQLSSALSSVRTLETDRSSYHQEAARHIQEIENITAKSDALEQELNALRQELDERRNDQEEEQDFLDRAQNEIEALRQEIISKDEELERLREVVSSPSSSYPPQSLDQEMFTSLKQQHAFELSAMQSQIRTLETSVFEAEARAHSLNKHVQSLEGHLAQFRATSRSFSPVGGHSRSSSRSDLHKSSFGPKPPLSRSVFDKTLSPETRHKRKVSLSMLKARIESETAAAGAPSRALSPVIEPESLSRPSTRLHHRPQFLDEAHVFWCHSCRGDLVIL